MNLRPFKCVPMLLTYRDSLAKSDNTHLLSKGKYHCSADLIFCFVGLDPAALLKFSTNRHVLLNPINSNRRLAIPAVILDLTKLNGETMIEHRSPTEIDTTF